MRASERENEERRLRKRRGERGVRDRCEEVEEVATGVYALNSIKLTLCFKLRIDVNTRIQCKTPSILP